MFTFYIDYFSQIDVFETWGNLEYIFMDTPLPRPTHTNTAQLQLAAETLLSIVLQPDPNPTSSRVDAQIRAPYYNLLDCTEWYNYFGLADFPTSL